MMPTNSPAQIYEMYLVPAVFGPLAKLIVDLAQPAQSEHVLDAACGTGVVARMIAPQLGRSGRVVGLDYDPVMIAMARSLNRDIEWREGDIQNLPFADEAFDLVVCQQGLQFLPDRTVGLREFHRVLVRGGRVALAIWTEIAKSPGHAKLFASLGARLGVDMTEPQPWSLADGGQVLEMVSAAGFSDVKMKVQPLRARFPSARQFAEIMLNGSSRQTRQALGQLPADQKEAFVDEMAERLQIYETGGALELDMETRLLVGRKTQSAADG